MAPASKEARKKKQKTPKEAPRLEEEAPKAETPRLEAKDPGPEVQTPGPAAVPNPEAPTTSRVQKPPRKTQEPPKLPPYMRDTVALKLKEVDGRVPDMSKDVFCKKMLLDQGILSHEIFGIQAMVAGIFYVTFISMSVCKRYWEAVKAATPDSPFSKFLCSCLLQREERRIIVSMWNLRTPGKDIETFLQRYCTVVKGPEKVLNCYNLWMGKWAATVLLQKDSASEDGFKHLPQAFMLGNSHGLIYYPDMPQTCRKCGKTGHQMKACKEEACKNCRVTGHETKDCPRKSTCNLCGLTGHVYKTCPQRRKTWAEVAASAPGKGFEARSPAETTKKPKAKVSGDQPAEQKKASKKVTQTSRNVAKPAEVSKLKTGKTKKVTPSPPPAQANSKPSLPPTETTITPLVGVSAVQPPAHKATPQESAALTQTPPPAADPLSYTVENFPNLSSQALVSSSVPTDPDTETETKTKKKRKRKQAESPVAETTRKIVLVENEQPSTPAIDLVLQAEIENMLDYYPESPSFHDLPAPLNPLIDEMLDTAEGSPILQQEEPPDGIGN
ncbi:uncharacterized protein [Engystomops pustulosus]|uniref:uncharacterized protein n=1 Tax=Engystomops pustulosus TaxID=76066 RepID=UPI003AFAAB53